MTDEELVKRLRDLDLYSADIAADRIEELIEARDTMGHLWAKEAADKQVALGRIEALTEQLEAARADAKEAEAYAEELEKDRDDYAFKLADANNTYSEMHVALSEANDKLAKAVEGLREIASEASVTVHTRNKGGINYTRMYEDWRKLAVKRIDKARAVLAEIEGEKT